MLHTQLTNGVVVFTIQNSAACPELVDYLESFLTPYFWETEGLHPHFTLIFNDYTKLPFDWLNHPAEEVVIRKSTANSFNLSGRFFLLDDKTRVIIDEETKTAYHINEETNTIVFYGSKESVIHLIEFVRYTSLLVEEIEGTMVLHASATVHSESTYLVLGNKGAGKTSTLLNLIFQHGQKYFSGDKILVSKSTEGIIIRGWPDYPHVGIGTLKNFPNLVKNLRLPLEWADGTPKPDSHKELIEPRLFRAALPSTVEPSVKKVATLIFPQVSVDEITVSVVDNNERMETLLENIEYPHQFLTVQWHNLFGKVRRTAPTDYTKLLEHLLSTEWFKVTGKSGIPVELLNALSRNMVSNS